MSKRIAFGGFEEPDIVINLGEKGANSYASIMADGSEPL
jgi:hypothetical protein